MGGIEQFNPAKDFARACLARFPSFLSIGLSSRCMTACERLPTQHLPADPVAVAMGWPVDRPLLMLHSGTGGTAVLPVGASPGAAVERWARWSILASPDSWLTARTPGEANEALAVLERQSHTAASPVSPGDAPFHAGWIGLVAYDLGRVIEPTAQHGHAIDDRRWPLLAMGRCEVALVFDHVEGRWSLAGDVAKAAELASMIELDACEGSWCAGELSSATTPDAYMASVARAVALIAQGDIFQANITQRFSASFAGSTRALARAAFAVSRARYGAYLELPEGRCVVSMSPELFLEVDGASRRVVTRPIKGTLRGEADPAVLCASVKDAAELHMITDLMRNDLGRVCEYGSIRVAKPREIESHPTVHHGVSEVAGTLRRDVSVADLLRATFPPGSVTGAPKIRAMQIIDEIEPVQRGPYCGAMGFIGDAGNVSLNVAIRTIAITGSRRDFNGRVRWDEMEGVLDYGAGGGVVADSNPAAEYRESLDKAEVLRLALAGAGRLMMQKA